MCHFSSDYLKQGNKNHLYHPKVQFYHTVVYLFSFLKLLWSFKSPLHIGLTLMTHLWTLQISDIHIVMAFMGGSTNRQKDPKAISSTPFSSSPNNVFPSPIPLYDVLANIILRIKTSKLHSSWKHAIVQSEIWLSRLFRLLIQHLHSANYTGTAAGRVQTPHLGIQTIRTVSPPAHQRTLAQHGHISWEFSPRSGLSQQPLGEGDRKYLQEERNKVFPISSPPWWEPQISRHNVHEQEKRNRATAWQLPAWKLSPHPYFPGDLSSGVQTWETQGKAVGMLGKERFKRYRGKSLRITVFKLHPCSQPTLD